MGGRLRPMKAARPIAPIGPIAHQRRILSCFIELLPNRLYTLYETSVDTQIQPGHVVILIEELGPWTSADQGRATGGGGKYQRELHIGAADLPLILATSQSGLGDERLGTVVVILSHGETAQHRADQGEKPRGRVSVPSSVSSPPPSPHRPLPCSLP